MVDDQNVGMIESAGSLGFLFKAAQPVSVSRVGSRQNFNGHFASQLRISGAVYNSHPTFADFVSNTILPDGFSNHLFVLRLRSFLQSSAIPNRAAFDGGYVSKKSRY